MKKILQFFLARILYLFIAAINSTLKISMKNPEKLEEIKKSGNYVIFAIWHQSTLPLFYLYRNTNIVALTAKGTRGEIISYCARKFGYRVVRVPFRENSREAAVGVIKMLGLLKENNSEAAIVVDGPCGPFYKVKPGIFFLAQKSGRAVVPVGVGVPKRLELPWRWDKYIIPMPFSRVNVLIGDPVMVHKDDDQIKFLSPLLEERLQSVTWMAENIR